MAVRPLALFTLFISFFLLALLGTPAAVARSASGHEFHDPAGGLSCASEPANLVSWWPGDGQADDLIGGYHGALQNGAAFAAGLVDEAFSLDGVSDLISVTHTAAHNPTHLTVEAWFYAEAIAGQVHPPLLKKSGPTSASGYALELDTQNNTLGFWMFLSGSWHQASTATPILTDTWYHAVGTYDGADLRLYLDGSPAGVVSVAGLSYVPATGPLFIGSDPANPNRFFKGLIDEVRLYNRALSEAEVLALHGAGSAGMCKTVARSSKAVSATTARPGETLTYTIALVNADPLSPTTMALTDALPNTLAYIPGSLTATSGSFGYAGHTITWTESVAPATSITLTFRAAADFLTPSGTAITNSAQISGGGGVITRSATLMVQDCVPVPAGLVSWWPGDGQANDLMGGHHGVFQNGATTAAGMVGRAFNLDGVNDLVGVAHTGAHNPLTLTVEAWFYASALTGQVYPPIVKKGGPTPGLGYALEIDSQNNTLGFWVSFNGAWSKASFGTPLSPNTWYHAVGTYDGADLRLYLNGSLVGATNVVGLSFTPASLPLYIGADPSNPNRFFKGLIDEVRLFGRALSASEVQALYAAGNQGVCPGILPSTKSVSSAVVAPGEAFTYTIALVNGDSLSSTLVVMTDTLPAALAYVPGSLTATSGSYGYAGHTITWTGSISAVDSVTLTFGASLSSTSSLGTAITNSAVISGWGQVYTRSATVSVPLAKLWLPLMTLQRPTPGLAGRVTLNGAAVAGVPLMLRFYNGSVWSTLATTTTDGDGAYLFSGLPALGPGQIYYVLFLNPAGPADGRLSSWSTRQLTTYTGDVRVSAGDFDLADIMLLSPAPGSVVALPTTFQWTRRPATPSDSYDFNLFDPGHSVPFFYTNPPLGYTGAYTLMSLPAGFSPGVPYGWFVGVFSPDGGYGESFYYRPVAFSALDASYRLSPSAHPLNRWTAWEARPK